MTNYRAILLYYSKGYISKQTCLPDCAYRKTVTNA